MIKNVIFDIGRVLISYEPYEYVQKFGYSPDISKKVCDIVFEDKKNRGLERDRGTLSDEAYLDMLITENPEYSDKIKAVFNNWISMLTPLKDSVDFYISLKAKGYKIYLLSNFPYPAYEQVEAENEFLRLADGKIISYAVKAIKPEKKIYELLISKYNLIPNECVFIDDREENIIAANKLGIKGIQFKDIKTTSNQFETIIKSLNTI